MIAQTTVICLDCEQPFDRSDLDRDGRCEECADSVIEARAYGDDLDDERSPDSDPWDIDRDEYEPGGMYFEREPASRHTIHGHTGPEGQVQAQHWTNDNLDRGYPSENATWMQTYGSVHSFREVCGVTRQGFGCYVEVWLDGVQQWSPEEMARLDRVNDLAGHISGELARLLGEFPGATYAEVVDAVARLNPDGAL